MTKYILTSCVVVPQYKSRSSLRGIYLGPLLKQLNYRDVIKVFAKVKKKKKKRELRHLLKFSTGCKTQKMQALLFFVYLIQEKLCKDFCYAKTDKTQQNKKCSKFVIHIEEDTLAGKANPSKEGSIATVGNEKGGLQSFSF